MKKRKKLFSAPASESGSVLRGDGALVSWCFPAKQLKAIEASGFIDMASDLATVMMDLGVDDPKEIADRLRYLARQLAADRTPDKRRELSARRWSEAEGITLEEYYRRQAGLLS